MPQRTCLSCGSRQSVRRCWSEEHPDTAGAEDKAVLSAGAKERWPEHPRTSGTHKTNPEFLKMWVYLKNQGEERGRDGARRGEGSRSQRSALFPAGTAEGAGAPAWCHRAEQPAGSWPQPAGSCPPPGGRCGGQRAASGPASPSPSSLRPARRPGSSQPSPFPPYSRVWGFFSPRLCLYIYFNLRLLQPFAPAYKTATSVRG